MTLRAFGVLFLLLGGAASAQPSVSVAADPPDATQQPVLAVVERFERALAAGDRAAALAQLAPELRVFESGHVERSREEYASEHLGADMEFLKTAQTALKSRRIDVTADSALVLSEIEIRSVRDGRTATRASLETLVLHHGTDGWRIVHIHWSSREISP
ncbi:MAG TPA: nuclear transport factor 2 family protein [Tahibacter sp.]|uniref:DUF4440 domain-containing protein n=1 Tax=Tahibacter sp. TaxID=2056211 RepID=UPI002C92C75B|nr:nuclear transport factor 2 family protein [Tahibacter sp.]HSX60791.1 nuclear transport factor 2 family protein [Tahibacter sp.]